MPGRKQKHKKNNQKSSGSGTGHIAEVNLVYLPGQMLKRKPYTGSPEKKGEEKNQILTQEIPVLSAIPDNLQRFKGNLLNSSKREKDRERKKERKNRKGGREVFS